VKEREKEDYDVQTVIFNFCPYRSWQDGGRVKSKEMSTVSNTTSPCISREGRLRLVVVVVWPESPVRGLSRISPGHVSEIRIL
jgi:hypothetical protein